ncbi:cuticle protein 8-like [Periplaneta americana]|uniref:cuticle protein 8-like n=1 Tax=Periplaneta americana TaxID=6978 RepID=UPI0037E87502
MSYFNNCCKGHPEFCVYKDNRIIQIRQCGLQLPLRTDPAMTSKLLLVVLFSVAVSAAPPVSFNTIPVRQGIYSPAVTYTSSPAVTYASSSPARYAYASPVVEAYHPVATPAVYAAKPQAYASPVVEAYRPVASPAVFAAKSQGAVDPNYDPNPAYSYAYSVNDPETGDAKSHEETRNGDSVQGSYSVVESDGTRRTVEYSADAVSGFNAVVHREVGAAPPPPVAVKSYSPAPVVAARVAAPAVAYQSSPAVAFQSAPAVARVGYKPAPAVAYNSIPAVAYHSVPEVAFQSAPAVRYAVPAAQPVAYSSVQPGNVHTSFSAPFANYAY